MGRIQQRPERLLATCLLVLALASFSASGETQCRPRESQERVRRVGGLIVLVTRGEGARRRQGDWSPRRTLARRQGTTNAIVRSKRWSRLLWPTGVLAGYLRSCVVLRGCRSPEQQFQLSKHTAAYLFCVCWHIRAPEAGAQPHPDSILAPPYAVEPPPPSPHPPPPAKESPPPPAKKESPPPPAKKASPPPPKAAPAPDPYTYPGVNVQLLLGREAWRLAAAAAAAAAATSRQPLPLLPLNRSGGPPLPACRPCWAPACPRALHRAPAPPPLAPCPQP